MDVLLYAPGAPEGARQRLDLDGDSLEVIIDGPARLVAGRGRPRRLQVVDLGEHSVASVSLESDALVYADRFSSDDLHQLQTRGICGIDRVGQLVVATADLVTVLGRPRAKASESTTDVTIATLRGRQTIGDPSGVRGAATVRLTQLLLEHPERIWQPTELGALDGKAAVATASRLLSELANLGLLATVARDRTHKYRIVNRELLARWLADRARPPTPAKTLSCYVRARSATELVSKLAVATTNIPYVAVLTGSAAALLEGASKSSSLPVAQVRVDPKTRLSNVFRDFGASPAPAANNVRLISDVGEVGTLHHRTLDGVPVAGVIRTWLDLRSETRGEDAADLYWEQVISAAAIGAS